MPKTGGSIRVRTNDTSLWATARRHGPAIAVFLVATLCVVAFLTEHPVRETAGDEPTYFRLAVASEPLDPSLPTLLPGNMPLYWWPPLTFALYGMMVTPADLAPSAPRLPHDRHGMELATPESFVRRVSLANAVGMLVSGLLVYLIALQLGLSPPAATVALAATTLNPRLLFYVQTLWPEWLHAVVLLSAMALLVRFARDEGVAWLALASALLGVAALIKGVTPGFMVVLIPALLVLCRGNDRLRLVSIAAAAVVPFALVTGPQLLRNHHEHGAFVLSTNTWINVEAGILPPPQARNPELESVFDLYRRSAADPITRERLSRERVVEHLTEASPLGTLKRIARNYWFSIRHSFFGGSVAGDRWEGSQGLTWMVPLVPVLSALLFVVGIAGIVLSWRSHRAHVVLALFLVYYVLALGIVGFNPRFFVQAAPLLGIMAAFALDQAGSALRSKVRDTSSR
ncbi:MAG TPA: hypothetical protein VKA86_08080 [Candidatus Krumholzibacteria bacterium]|nr:hypothetical protein [Candidatus Krumholzibacteria bacterium]